MQRSHFLLWQGDGRGDQHHKANLDEDIDVLPLPALFEFGTGFLPPETGALKRGPEVDVSAQRPEIGDHHTREFAAKPAFLLASYQLRVGTRARTWDPLMNQGP